MKLLLPLLIGSLALTTAHSATLIEFTFDDNIPAGTPVGTRSLYHDVSGNNRDATFNRVVSVSTNYPFSSTHPELTGIDNVGRTRYNAATSGSVANVSGINLNLTNTFTMEGWIRLEGFATISGSTSGGSIWNISSDVGGTSLFQLRYTSTGVVQALFNSRSQEGGTRTFDTGVTLELDEWTHLAYVKHGNSVEIFINGESVGNFTVPNITSRVLPTALTSIGIGGNIYGSFDDFRLSNTALSAAELGYHTPFTTIPEPSTVALLVGAATMGAIGFARRRVRR